MILVTLYAGLRSGNIGDIANDRLRSDNIGNIVCGETNPS